MQTEWICRSIPLLWNISFNKSGDVRPSLCSVSCKNCLNAKRDAGRVVSSARWTFVVLLGFLLTFLSLFLIWCLVRTPTSVRCASDCVIERCRAALACFCHITTCQGRSCWNIRPSLNDNILICDSVYAKKKKWMQPYSVPFCWAAAPVFTSQHCKQLMGH